MAGSRYHKVGTVFTRKFYKKYSNTGIINLSSSSRQSICQLFVEEYLNQKNESKLSEDDIWNGVESALEGRGIKLFKQEINNKPVTPLIQPSFKIGDVFNEESEEIQKESEGVKD
ncbi:hypothetical protein Avbf_06894 [Armadillidium vulgare]|nr:hypothetical protein Avbf_06894 [Armadillidium vulgare]